MAITTYFVASMLSFLIASQEHGAGAMKVLGMAELCLLSILTGEMVGSHRQRRLFALVISLSSVAVAVTALIGIALFYSGLHTPLVGVYGEHLAPSSWYVRVQAFALGPNALASFCLFAAAMVAWGEMYLPKGLSMIARGALAFTVAFTFSHYILAFTLAALVRNARTRIHRWSVVVIACIFALANLSLTVLNPIVDPVHPLNTTFNWEEPSGRWQTVTSALRTVREHPVWGMGPGTSPGWYRNRPYDAHLTLLNVAGTLGLPALAAFISVFIVLWRSRERPTNMPVWSAFAGFALASLVCDIEDFRHLWVMIGIAATAQNKNPVE